MPAPDPARIVVEVGDARSFLKDDERSRLADVARRVLEAEGVVRAEISLAVVDDPTIHEVNRRHLDHDWPTDVISFVLSEPGDEVMSGELIVSAETASRMAARDGEEVWTELVLYVVHGLLHLCGHDDLTEEGAAGMRRREGELLAAEGLEHPFSPARPSGEAPTLPPSPGGGEQANPSPLVREGRVGGGPTEGLLPSLDSEATPWRS